ncbi:hypothetical protein [Vitiosangium sp. GDMCC 1.1324]|uniref:hypothetical protein n=1 Tax=Vitiosangium sp. (strain GDMCC 1.1324) TaxID=2138576 RepID=UPI00130DBD2D|nr:hypothetical protein [Vitiosangium sp. GDMCC 1.1324]
MVNRVVSGEDGFWASARGRVLVARGHEEACSRHPGSDVASLVGWQDEKAARA